MHQHMVCKDPSIERHKYVFTVFLLIKRYISK